MSTHRPQRELHELQLDPIISKALTEDLGYGDWTTDIGVDPDKGCSAVIIAKLRVLALPLPPYAPLKSALPSNTGISLGGNSMLIAVTFWCCQFYFIYYFKWLTAIIISYLHWQHFA